MGDLGKVYLIGGGPGDPRLLTLKAKDCLEKADTVVYDRLSNLQLLSYANGDAEFIYCGKAPGAHSLSQDEINGLLAEKAARGRIVVRLHGGDPFVFGRGGEEAEVLRRNGLPYEVVPGISSSIAVPAYLGIPVTDRRCSSSFAVFTGHRMKDSEANAVDGIYGGKASDTLVFLMGMENLEEIASGLISQGLSPDTPAAAIQWGTTAGQRAVKTTLASLAKTVGEGGLGSPAVVIAGRVVELHAGAEWRKVLPLAGRRVLITRPAEQSRPIAETVSDLGGEPLIFPCTDIEEAEDLSHLDKAILNICNYDWLAFVSGNGVDLFFKRLFGLGMDARSLRGVKVAAVGGVTAARLRGYGISADLVPGAYDGESLGQAILGRLGQVRGVKFLIPRAEGGGDTLRSLLVSGGALVDEVKIYRSVLPNSSYFNEVKRHLQNGLERPLDIILFASSSAVANFAASLGKEKARALCERAEIACIGPVTARTAEELGLHASIVASEHDGDGLLKAVVDHVTLSGHQM